MLGISKDDEGGPDARDAKTGKDDEGGLVARKFFFFLLFTISGMLIYFNFIDLC